MKKIIPVWLTVLIAAIVVSGPVEVVSNLLADAGVDCEVSMWMLTAEPGSNKNHTFSVYLEISLVDRIHYKAVGFRGNCQGKEIVRSVHCI